ncbi:MAG: transposase [Campylobacterota bacterium]|nr:transposase [Campylobacterota bacterium]
MPRRPRVDMVGSYHIVNRGVDKRVIYKDNEDHKTFLQILCDASTIYEVRVHAYVMMSNHYHLLIETTQENLSKYMKHINASYAIYFNKKYKRSGHLWQGRFKSWFVTQESYLYALTAYIEYNPIKAKMAKKLGEYKHSSYRAFSEQEEAVTCLKSSFVFEQYPNVNERMAFIQYAHDERVLGEIKKASNLVVTSIKNSKPNVKSLEKKLKKVKNIHERNKVLYEANKKGFSQHLLSEVTGISQSQIGRIVLKERVRVT